MDSGTVVGQTSRACGTTRQPNPENAQNSVTCCLHLKAFKGEFNGSKPISRIRTSWWDYYQPDNPSSSACPFRPFRCGESFIVCAKGLSNLWQSCQENRGIRLDVKGKGLNLLKTCGNWSNNVPPNPPWHFGFNIHMKRLWIALIPSPKKIINLR